jgi:hypothetical protein
MGGPSSKEVGAQQQSWSNLNQLFGTASDAASSFGSAGKGTLDQVTNYFKTLLGGNRQATMQAEAPGINAARESSDAAKNEAARTGTARTGGTAAENQKREDTTQAQISNLISGAAPAAASALTGIGESDINAMMSALGLGTQATGTAGSLIGSDVNSKRQASADMWASLIGGGGKVGAAAI